MTTPDGLRSQSQHESSIAEDGILSFWETRYAMNGQVWSGLPNQALTKALEDIPPGYALDVGCGEGADALWLAERGWTVDGIDLSPTAIEHARSHADKKGASRASFEAANFMSWSATGRKKYDLVVACFLHARDETSRLEMLNHALKQVAPNGRFLVVSHAGSHPKAPRGHAGHRHERASPEGERAALGLSDSEWHTEIASIQSREVAGLEGTWVSMEDSVLLVRRKKLTRTAGLADHQSRSDPSKAGA